MAGLSFVSITSNTANPVGYRSAMTPQSLLQTLAAWSVRYGLHVHWCGSREGGEYLTHSLLEKFLKEQQTRLAALVRAHGVEAA